MKDLRIDLYNGIIVGLTNGRDGKAARLTLDGRTKKLSEDEVSLLIEALTSIRNGLRK